MQYKNWEFHVTLTLEFFFYFLMSKIDYPRNFNIFVPPFNAKIMKYAL